MTTHNAADETANSIETTPHEPVEDVYGMTVTGASIMLGVYPDGDTELQVYTADAASPLCAAADVEDGLLPPAEPEMGGGD